MTNRKKYSGVVIPMVTPFTQSGKIDDESTLKIVNNLISKDTAPFLFGTTGEGPSIFYPYKKDIVRKVVEFAHKKVAVYAGISSNSINESIELGKQFFDLGVDVVVAHLPSYYPLNADQMLQYYEVLIENIPGQLMLYNIPATTHLSIPLEVVERLGRHPRIVGLKDSERDLLRLKKAAELFKNRKDFSYFIGWGAQCTGGLILGADGLVPSSGNFIPGIYKELYDAVSSGDIERGNSLQEETNVISSVYQKDKSLSQSLASLKFIMSTLGLCGPKVIPPLLQLTNEEINALKKELEILNNKYVLR